MKEGGQTPITQGLTGHGYDYGFNCTCDGESIETSTDLF